MKLLDCVRRASSVFLALLVALVVATAPASAAGPEDDYGRSRPGGLTIPWQPLLEGDGLDGWRGPIDTVAWSRVDDAIVGKLGKHEKSRIVRGDSTWRNYEFSVHATLEEGSTMQFPFRIADDGRGLYFVEMDYAWQTVNVTLREADRRGVTKLSVVNYPLVKGREYHLIVSARHRSLTTYIDGKLVNQASDTTHESGGVGIGMWWSTRATYRSPKVRHYHWP